MSDKKTILITGAASGIGRATALLFAREGWYVGLYDIDQGKLDALATEIGQTRCCYGRMDVSDPASVRQAIESFVEHSGGSLRVLFNNAGILKAGFFKELSLDEQLRIVDVNLKGVINCTHVALPYLKTSKDARVINMSSASSVYGTAHLAAYSASKAAVSSLTESLNMELEAEGVHVYDIRVPYVQTPLLESGTRAASLDSMGAKLSPEDVAGLVYRSLKSRSVHYDSTGMWPLLMLKRLAPTVAAKAVLRKFMMPK